MFMHNMEPNYGQDFLFNLVQPDQQILGQQALNQITDNSSYARQLRDTVNVIITEQPASKALRWRYESEGRTAGSLSGVNSTSQVKTYPTIQVVGWKGKAKVVVSCVTVKDYKPHPHKLVGKDCGVCGVCTTKLDKETMTAVFNNLGVHCVKRRDIRESLRLRNSIKVDAFNTGYEHRKDPNIDLSVFRLGFQVFLKNPSTGFYNIPLKSIYSDPIMDKKPEGLNIVSLSDCTAEASGGRKIILLCEKVDKNDIQVRFFEMFNDRLIFEDFGRFHPKDVHKQVAITFFTPKFRSLDIAEPAKVQVQLRKPSTGELGNPIPFEFTPVNDSMKRFLDDRMNSFENALLNKENGLNFLCNIKKEPEPGPSNYNPEREVKLSNLTRPSAEATTLWDMDNQKLENWNSGEIAKIVNEVNEIPLLSFDEEMMTNSFKNLGMSSEKSNNLN